MRLLYTYYPLFLDGEQFIVKYCSPFYIKLYTFRRSYNLVLLIYHTINTTCPTLSLQVYCSIMTIQL